MRSYVTRKHGPESPPKVCAAADLVHLPRFPAMGKPILGPEAIHQLSVGFVHTGVQARDTQISTQAFINLSHAVDDTRILLPLLHDKTLARPKPDRSEPADSLLIVPRQLERAVGGGWF